MRVCLVGWGAAALLLAACGQKHSANAGDPAQVALGATVYEAHCTSCHGARLEGQPDWRERRPDGKLPAPPHDASGHTWHHPDATLFEITKHGITAIAGRDYATDMPAFKGRLADEEIWAVLAYIKSRWPEEIRRKQAAIDEASKRAAR